MFVDIRFLRVSMLLRTSFRNKYIKSTFPSERKIVCSTLPLKLILIEHEVETDKIEKQEKDTVANIMS